jgi:sacsin
LISSQPYIFSNGYHIKFNEKPCAECNIGYVVPEWVESTPILSDIENVYGCSKVLPTTTIILPLKSEKVDAVKKQLSSLHPEMLLFLSKIRKLSVREHNSDPKSSAISEIAISIENNFQSRKNIHAESYTLHLSAEETGKVEEECGYYIWRQKFPVKSENKVEKRAEIDEWVITLAFPLAERLSRKNQLFPGVYAFLPTEMVTNFPFIIQADFLLASSREAILFDSPWNKGILECVPNAFMSAFVTLVKSTPDAPAMSIPSMFKFLPVNPSLISVLEPVRSGIKEKVIAEHIVPCESYASQKIFCKASEIARLKPAFWTILQNAREFGVDLKNLSTHGTYILSSHFDRSTYDSVLKFLEVKNVGPEWYAKCIEGSNLVKEVNEQLYLDLLYFVAVNWQNYFSGTNMMSIPLLKCVNRNDSLSFWSISRAIQGCDRLCIASEMEYMSWLISWNKEFPCSNRFFIQPKTQSALEDFSQKTTVKNWLQHQAKVEFVSVCSYASTVVNSLNNAHWPVISFAQFLYHSDKKSYIDSYNLQQLCQFMPVIDRHGKAVSNSNSIMVPWKGSKWVGLMGTNPWEKDGYIELSADYKSAGHFAGNYTSEDQLLEFLKTHLQVSDVPFIHPPNASFPAVRSPLTVDNALLLLEWIRNRKSKGRLPDQFLASVKEGGWLMTSLGYKPPKESFLSNAKWGSILQNGSSFVDIPMIDQQFYRNKLYTYTDELKLIGVRFEFQEASAYIGSCLLSKAAGNALTRENVYSLLRLIRYLGEEFLSPAQLINSVKDGQWMKSTLGYRCPADCIIRDSEWEVASHISNQSFLDVQFYGKDILHYAAELELLGVIGAFKENYRLVIKNFKFSSAAITSKATTLILKCIRYVNQCEDFIRKLKDLKWLKTNVGFRAPNEIFLVNPEWECLLKVFDGIPVIDYRFYGSEIGSYKEELKKIGLIMRFEEASKAITKMFKEMVSKSSLTKASALALLGSYRQLRTHQHLPVELFNCMRNEKWLHTLLGFRSPSEAILFDDTWQSLSPIANLPFIDDGDSLHGLGKEIYDYKDELRELGVTVEAKNGARFAISGLSIPSDPSTLTKATVMSLLACIKSYFKFAASPPKGFEDKICMKWLKTSMGYQCPDECILFDAKQSSLCMEDGPFIDEGFYGSELVSFKDSLARIGVTVDVKFGQDLVARHLRSNKVRTTISRIYLYLMECNWKPNDKDKSSNWIWIPNEMEDGEWVSSGCCVLSDENNLFSQQIHVLDKYYDKELLVFFSLAFGVKRGPDAEDYCKLWSTWESSVPELEISDCSAFWMFIATNWSKNTQRSLAGCVKVPVCIDGKITLSKKEDVFIPDDLLLTDLFKTLPQQSLFIWYPPSTIPSMSRARLNIIYDSIGVQRLSKAARKNDSFTSESGHFITVNSSKVIKAGLLHIVLAFLADPALNIPTERRHSMVSCLLNVTVQENDEPITVGYSVSLSSGEVVNVKARRMLRWERENSKLYIQSSNDQSSYKEKIEFATYFAEEISKGLLFEMPDQIPSLGELIKFGSLLDFEDDAVEFLHKSHNLQLFPEDEVFIARSVP